MARGYTREKISVQEAINHISEYDYALIYNISSMKLCKTEKLTDFDIGECLEARFFSGQQELHIFDGEEGKEAIIIHDSDPEYIITKKYELANKYQTEGKYILVNEYISYDEDGQLFIEHTRLKGIS